MAGLLTRPSVRLTVATSSAVVSSPYWAAYHLVTFCLKCGDHLAKSTSRPPRSPWQNTTLGLVCVGSFCSPYSASRLSSLGLALRNIHSLMYGEQCSTETPAQFASNSTFRPKGANKNAC